MAPSPWVTSGPEIAVLSPGSERSIQVRVDRDQTVKAVEGKHAADDISGDHQPERPCYPRRVDGAAQRQRRHLQGCGPPLASLMQLRQIARTDLDPEVRQQLMALGQREVQVTVTKLVVFAVLEPEPP